MPKVTNTRSSQVRVLYLHGVSGNTLAMAGFGTAPVGSVGSPQGAAGGQDSAVAPDVRRRGFGLPQEPVRFRVLGGAAGACQGAGDHASDWQVLELRPCDLARCAALWTRQVLGMLDQLLPSVLAAVAEEAEAARVAGLLRGGSRAGSGGAAGGGGPKAVGLSKAGSGGGGSSVAKPARAVLGQQPGPPEQPQHVHAQENQVEPPPLQRAASTKLSPFAGASTATCTPAATPTTTARSAAELASAAAGVLAKTGALFLEPGADVQLHYFASLACHSFEQGAWRVLAHAPFRGRTVLRARCSIFSCLFSWSILLVYCLGLFCTCVPSVFPSWSDLFSGSVLFSWSVLHPYVYICLCEGACSLAFFSLRQSGNDSSKAAGCGSLPA